MAALLKADAQRWRALGAVAALYLPHGCIGAGFVRNLVWDRLHGRPNDCADADADVLHFDARDPSSERDAALERTLRNRAPGLRWSVRNQARMHANNGDAPYPDVTGAMRCWPETATAVAARRIGDRCELMAPFGIEDLLTMTLRPPDAARAGAFERRLRRK